MARHPDDGGDLSEVERDLRHHVHQYWKAYALQGALSLLLGLLAVAAPFAATYATVLFFGILLVASGIAGIAGSFTIRGEAGSRSGLALAAAVLLLGLVMLFDPFAGAVSLTVLLAVFFLLSALANFAFARALKGAGGRSWLLFASAAINLVLAVYLVVALPETAVFAIGLFLGISFAMSGAGMLAAALAMRRA